MKKYMYVYEKIKEDIVSGAIKSGQKLPSKRTIADMLGVSVITAEHALEILEAEGYVSAKPRSGFYVDYTTEKFFGAVPAKEKPAAKRPVGDGFEDESFPFSLYSRAVRTVLSERGADTMKKSPGTGLP